MCSELQSQDATSGFSGSDLELDAVTAHPDWCKRMPGLMGILKLGLMGKFWMVASKEQKEFNKWNSSHLGEESVVKMMALELGLPLISSHGSVGAWSW